MAGTVGIGNQGFANIREHGDFYVDKTGFVRDWWLGRSGTTLITRPRRFGKTLALDTCECFFSTRYAKRADLFEGLAVWDDPGMRAEQGTWPVIFISFADVKESTFEGARSAIYKTICDVYRLHRDEIDPQTLGKDYLDLFEEVGPHMDGVTAMRSIRNLCELLHRRYGKKAIVLLDEYDAPFQEAWLGGYWEQMTEFARSFFNATFKTNAFLERGLITGVTCVAQESIISDMNNPDIVLTTTEEYETSFGFTEKEVLDAMNEFGLEDFDGVRSWYDGFRFGDTDGIYNPWSITHYLDSGQIAPYWVNTSSNSLAADTVRRGDKSIKQDFERLLTGKTVTREVDQRVAFQELGVSDALSWGLLLASGYLKATSYDPIEGTCVLKLTNLEVAREFGRLVLNWFGGRNPYGPYNEFVRSLLGCDVRSMNAYMNDVALATFSMFDSATHPGIGEPERFYHGFVLGLVVCLKGRYAVLSNRESGYGRYDVVLDPLDRDRDDAFILEFKVFDPSDEKDLSDTVQRALAQIEAKGYAADLVARGVPAERIHAFGLAFEGKHVLIG